MRFLASWKAALVAGGVLRLLFWLVGGGSVHFTFLDEVDAWIWANNLAWVNHANFGSFLPGPWQSLLGWGLLKLAGGSAHGWYAFWFVVGTLQIALLHAAVRVWSGDRVAFWAAWLGALLPFPVHFTAAFWNPYFAVPLATALFLCLGHLRRRPESGWIFGVVLLAGVIPFFHFVVVFSLPLLLAFLRMYRVRPAWKWTALALGVIVLLYLPYFLNDASHGFVNSRGWAKSASGRSSYFVWETLKAFTNPLLVLTTDFTRFTGLNWATAKFFLARWWGHESVAILATVPSALFVLSFVGVLFRRLARADWKAGWTGAVPSFTANEARDPRDVPFLAIFTFGSLLLFMATGSPHHERYLVVIWPVLLLGAAHLAARWAARPVAKWILVAMLVQATWGGIVLPFHHRSPNTADGLRLPPSVLTLQFLESRIAASVAPGRPAHADLPKSASRFEPFLSLRPPLSAEARRVLPPAVPVHLAWKADLRMDDGREIRTRDLLERFCAFEGRVGLVSDPAAASARFVLLASKEPLPPNGEDLGVFPDFRLVRLR